jgi:hypothetical protein
MFDTIVPTPFSTSKILLHYALQLDQGQHLSYQSLDVLRVLKA